MNIPEQLTAKLKKIHNDCYIICRNVLGYYPSNGGNIAIFCQTAHEFETLNTIKNQITHPSDTPNQKYFEIKEKFALEIPDTKELVTYSRLYIRGPDSSDYGKFLGDVDFYLSDENYQKFKESVINGDGPKGATFYERPGWDNVQLTYAGINCVAYVGPKHMIQKVWNKFD